MSANERVTAYPEVKLFIDGRWIQGVEALSVVDPATSEAIGTVAKVSLQQLEEAVAAAGGGLRVWSAVSAYERCKVMRRAAQILRERREDTAWLMTREQGKPLSEALGEILHGADIIEWFAEEGRRAYGQTIAPRIGSVSQSTIKVPVGIVAAFSPWNFPINQVVRKLAGALAAGCSIIIKAPEEAPASPAELIRAFADAGIPDGVVNLVYGVPAEISQFLIAHPLIRKISFTGSTPVGKHLASLAGLHMKRVTMELGGHAPAIVLEDADIDKAVKVLVAAKFRNAGQVCVAPTRILVERGVARAFVEKFVDAAKSLTVGNGLDPQTQMGPLANARRLAVLDALITDAIQHGGKLELGGRRRGERGNFFEPTVLSNVPTQARIMNEEPFGPVAILNTVGGLEEAIAEANRLPYGLASYAFTRSVAAAHALGTRIEAGMTSINHNGLALPEVPFGGIKDSGYGNEGGSEAIDAFLMTKFITVAA